MMRKILGPPGTGKTTRLLHYARTFLKLGTPLDKIGYFAFTKKAAGEAKERMLDQNPHISAKELKHFRTLHSLAFWKLGRQRSWDWILCYEQFLLEGLFVLLSISGRGWPYKSFLLFLHLEPFFLLQNR